MIHKRVDKWKDTNASRMLRPKPLAHPASATLTMTAYRINLTVMNLGMLTDLLSELSRSYIHHSTSILVGTRTAEPTGHRRNHATMNAKVVANVPINVGPTKTSTRRSFMADSA